MSYNSKRTGAEVETLLDKAETALQSVPSEYVTEGVLNEGLKGKADVDGVYPEMTVGMTRDMLGVGEGDEGEFLFRPTDGDGSIKDGFASIERIEGNSVVWNQMIDEPSGEASTTGSYIVKIFNTAVNTYKHKVLIWFDSVSWESSQTSANDIQLQINNYTWVLGNTTSNAPISTYKIVEVPKDGSDWIGIRLLMTGLTSGEMTTLRWKDLRVVDLTKMFGAGYEPLTLEEFYQRIPSGVDLNAYNEGEVVNMKVQGIKSVGFNAWDEEWELGYIDTITGKKEDYGSILRNKNLIPILPNAQYFANVANNTGDNGYALFYDKEGDYLGYAPMGGTDPSFQKVNTPTDARYMNFFLNGSYGSTYNHDVCINLVHTGYRNGEYEPYKESEVALPILNYFPNGMRSIGSVCDEITQKQTIQRIGTVDLGSCDWTYSSLGNFYYSKLEGAVTPESWYIVGNILSAPYTTVIANEIASASATRIDKTIGIAPDGSLYVVNQAYTDVTSFKEAMKGVILYYELAEPIVTSIDKILALDYQVWDFGTEEAIAERKTTPLKASIIYEFNARDTIRNNRNMVEELLRRATALSQEIEKKQDIISDLSTIRSGANKGDTSEQTANKTTTLSSSSTDSQYPSAKAVYDALQNVGGGGGSANRPIVKHGNADTIFTLTPNTVHQWEHVASLSLTIPQDDSYELEFFVLVEPNSSDFILTMSSDIQWANGDIPAFEAGKQYEINIRGSRASYNMYYAPAPSGTYISYVENNGSDYILTDIIIDNNIVGFEAKVVPLFDKPSESSTYYSLMGTRKTSSTADTSIGIYYMSSGVIPYWSGAKKSSVGSIVNGEMLTIDIDYGAIAVNNTNPLAIFGLNTAGNVERIGKFRIYSLAFNNAAGEKVFDLKPFKRMDGAYGLRDTISGKFYTSVKNQLTGA